MTDVTGTFLFGIQLTEANFHQWKLRVLDNYSSKCKAQHCYGMGSHIGFQAYFACYGTLLFYFFYTFISVLVLYLYVTDHLAVYLYSRKN